MVGLNMIENKYNFFDILDTYNNTVKDDDVMLYYPKNNYIANY